MHKAKIFGMKIWHFLDGQLFDYFQLFVYFSQISHLEASNTKIAQSKDVRDEYLESKLHFVRLVT